MSRSHQKTISCPNCGEQRGFTVWDSINVTVDPNLKQSLLNGELTTFVCNRCGEGANVTYDLLYHDMEKSLAIWLVENDDDERRQARMMFSSAAGLRLRERFARYMNFTTRS